MWIQRCRLRCEAYRQFLGGNGTGSECQNADRYRYCEIPHQNVSLFVWRMLRAESLTDPAPEQRLATSRFIANTQCHAIRHRSTQLFEAIVRKRMKGMLNDRTPASSARTRFPAGDGCHGNDYRHVTLRYPNMRSVDPCRSLRPESGARYSYESPDASNQWLKRCG